MLLVIEDKDDPCGQIAIETEDIGGAELAYIPAITVRLAGDPQQIKRNCVIERMGYECRKDTPKQLPAPEQAGKLVLLYLKALRRTGQQPDYISPSALDGFAVQPAKHSAKFFTTG